MIRAAVRRAALLLALVAGLVVIYAGYRVYVDRYTVATDPDGVAVARVVQMRFEGASDLKVGTLTGTVQSTGSNPGWFAWLDSSYVMIAPFEVAYFVDLSRMRPSEFRWDGTHKVLTVVAPEVRAGSVNVDESRLYIEDTKGVFVSRAAMAKMRRQASVGARRLAEVEATRPDKLDAARLQARKALAQLLAAPLHAAGLGNVTVEVVLPGDQSASEHWDRSRSLQDVLGNAQLSGTR